MKRVDAPFAGGLTLIALSGLQVVYAGLGWLLIGGLAVALGLGVAVVADRFRLPVLPTCAVAVVAWVLLAGPIALPGTTIGRVLPTVDTLRQLASGLVPGWRDLLTVLPPVATDGHVAVIPYLCGFAGSFAALLLATRTRVAALPLLAPAVVLVAGVLLGTGAPALLWAQGGMFAAVALGWTAVRSARGRPAAAPGAVGAVRPARLAGAAAMLVVASAAGYGTGLLGTDDARYVLRDHVERPFDPRAYPSPLAGLRRYEVAMKDKTLFTATGLPAGTRLRLATMDAYDGVVWSVSASGASSGSGVFERVGERVPAMVPGTDAALTGAAVRVTIRDLDGVWLPTAGELRRARFGGPRAATVAAGFRLNRDTGTAVTTARVAPGDGLLTDVVVTAPPDGQALKGRSVTALDLPRPENVPEIVAATATEWTGGVNAPVAQVQALADRMRAGAYSDGTADSGARSRPGHGAGRVRDFLAADQLVGDAEQYAATLALLVRALGLPARVVLGVVPPDGFTGTVTGSMMTAWAEVPVDGVGWVPFDPTPPVTNKPQPPRPQEQPQGSTEVVRPPVVVALPPPQLPPPDASQGGTSGRGPLSWRWLQLLITGLTYSSPVLVLALLLGLVAVGKSRRRRRRRERGSTGVRAAGGWAETLDGLRDLGVAVPARSTRRRAAVHLDEALAAGEQGLAARRDLAVSVVPIADVADEAVFGAGELGDETIRRYWADVERYLADVARTRSRVRRITAPVNPMTLLSSLRSRLAVKDRA
jgi:transglutaminase-like putative cysteine protease